MHYTHITSEQRYAIYVLLKAGCSQTLIAAIIGVNKSTVSREISRNSGQRGYRPKQADQRAGERAHTATKHIRFTVALKKTVTELLKSGWSPEQISGWLRTHKKAFVSHETIYQFILDDYAAGGELYTYLRRQHKKRRKRIKNNDRRGRIPNRVSIDQRDPIVDTKERVGDWEIDTIIGKNHKGALVTAVERTTKLSCIRHVAKKEAALVADALIDMLMPYKEFVHTITSDNGKEFSEHQRIAHALSAKFYFAHPYCAWERGLNENTNGLIRQYFPKKTSLAEVETQYVLHVQDALNNRPRKLLNFETPACVFLNSSVALGT